MSEITNLTKEEVVFMYRKAKFKTEQIHILAELTASDAETIIEVLKDAGAYEQRRIKQCIHCQTCFIDASKLGRIRICPSCKRHIRYVGNAQFYRKLRNGE